MLRRLLHWVGYAIAPVLFVGARTPEAVVRRLRFAYRLVGVGITERSTVDDIERTVFQCPYRGLGADRYGEKVVCHDILDRVDDGYVSYLARHRGIEYRRPRGCEEVEDDVCDDPEYCFSEVTAGD
ncbi:MAG: hypothetical protein ABEJ71_02995 [Halodesulfurarchaeum sp.]